MERLLACPAGYICPGNNRNLTVLSALIRAKKKLLAAMILSCFSVNYDVNDLCKSV